jgi:hypothetical protein
MKNKWLLLLIPPVIVAAGWAFGEVVMRLWNWLAPTLFGWHTITFWQGLGLLLLCRILFGNFGGQGHRDSNSRQRSGEKWERMTPEEREKFRHNMRGGCGGFGTPSGESGEPA